VKGKSSSYWEGRGHFDPVGASIDYFIDGDEGGPGASQRAVYRRIAENYPEVLRSITPLLKRECTKQMIREAAIFTLDSLSVPTLESDSMEWSMDFSCDDGDDWLFTVHMEGWRPSGTISVMH